MHNFIRDRMTSVGLPQPVQEFIIDEMTAPHRHYHTLAHLAIMLKQIDEAYSKNFIEAKHATPIVVATLFHDIVYEPTASDNEERSVAEAKLRLNHQTYDLGLISSLIMSTKRHDLSKYRERSDPTDPHYWIIYADLSILWSEPQRYSWYAHGVRAEYAHVPAELYRKGRADVIGKIFESVVNAFNGDYVWTLGGDPMRRLDANYAWEITQLKAGAFDVV